MLINIDEIIEIETQENKFTEKNMQRLTKNDNNFKEQVIQAETLLKERVIQTES